VPTSFAPSSSRRNKYDATRHIYLTDIEHGLCWGFSDEDEAPVDALVDGGCEAETPGSKTVILFDQQPLHRKNYRSGRHGSAFLVKIPRFRLQNLIYALHSDRPLLRLVEGRCERAHPVPGFSERACFLETNC
jgi:hypothetical protein